MSREKILLIEDDKHLAKLVSYNLEKAGWECFVCGSGEDGLAKLAQTTVDLIILDVMLPGIDGLEVCRRLKHDQNWAAIPVIMRTAKNEEVDRIVGFELGADDYVAKPFSPRELVLRIKAILKRHHPTPTPSQTLTFQQLRVDITRHKVYQAEEELELTPLEFKLLVTLMERQGKVQTRDVLIDDVWELAADVTTRTIDTHVKRLRQKLGAAGAYIETVRGFGYRFTEG